MAEARCGDECADGCGDDCGAALAKQEAAKNPDLGGYYAFAEYGWTQWSSAGLQFSQADEPADTAEDAYELDAYYTHSTTRFRRVRFGATYGDSDADDDFLRLYVQVTLFMGSHSHGLNW